MPLDADVLFSLASAVALLGWLCLIFLPRPWRFTFSLGIAVTVLALFYATLVFPALSGIDPMAFSTLDGIMELQGSRDAALVGWIHYLAFDLIAGWLIAHDAERIGLSRWLILPALLLTFMLGPVGWITYLLIRVLSRRGVLVKYA